MFPSLKIANVTDGGFIHLQLPCNGGSGFACVHFGADTQDNIISQFGLRVLRTFKRWRHYVSITGQGVRNVLQLVPSVKMGRIDASWRVAFVQNEQPFGDWSMVRHVRNAMRKTLGIYAIFISKQKLAIAFVLNASRPKPATISARFVNFIPKSFCEHFGRIVEIGSYVNRGVALNGRY